MGHIFSTPPVDLDTFLQTELPPISSWIEPGILPKGGKLLFGGLAKIGKSFMGLELARALVTGTTPYNCDKLIVPAKCKVHYVEAELGPYAVKDRASLIFAGVDAEDKKRMILNTQARGMDFSDPTHIQALIDRTLAHGTNVLIIDPIGKMHHYDENSNSEIARLFEKFEKILEAGKDNNLSIIFSHHFGKPPREPGPDFDPFSPYNFRGASKWFDDPDTIVTCVRVPKYTVGENGWVVKTKWETRRTSEILPEGAPFTIHRYGDGRVYYEPDCLMLKIPAKESKTKEPQTPYNAGSSQPPTQAAKW